MAITDYETLEICSILNLTNLKWSAPLLSADFGEGFGAGALAGSGAGLHRWSLSASVLPDVPEYAINYEIDDIEFTDSRFEYLWRFIKHHISHNNKPFIISDPRTKVKYLAAFDVADFDFPAITAKFFSGGIELIQRRAEDLTFNADGSLNVSDIAPPSGITTFATVSKTRTTINLNFTIPTDNSGFVVGFEVRIGNSNRVENKTNGVVLTSPTVGELQMGGLTPNTSYTFRIRTVDPSGNHSAWSNAVVETTNA
jgi:hypothetical protein